MGDGKKVVVPGGSGFLGRILAPWLAKRGWTVVVLSRGDSVPVNGVRSVKWDGHPLATGLGSWNMLPP